MSTSRNPGDQLNSAWEYYLEITGTEDAERLHDWQDFLNDGILVFVRRPGNPGSTLII